MKKSTFSFAIVFIVILFAACKKNDSAGSNSSFPKQVSITYRVTSTAQDSLNLITYSNETGGNSTVNNPRLPFTKTISKTVNKYEIISLGYFVNPAKVVKMEVLIDDQIVKSQETNLSNSALSYTFQ